MLMAITTVHDVARRAHRIVAVGRTIDSPTQRVEWAHRWDHRYILMAITTALDVAHRARGIVAVGRTIDSPTQRVEGCIDGVIDACLWR